MESNGILAVYESVALITDRMLAAARIGDWDQLIALESDCAARVQMLRDAGPLPPMTGSARDEKVRILKKILADDREIRALTEPWLDKLSAMINAAGTERKLSRAYGSMQAG